MQQTRQKRMNGKVTSTKSVIQPLVYGELISIRGERLEQFRFLKLFAGRLREKMLQLKTEQVPDCHESTSAHSRAERLNERPLASRRELPVSVGVTSAAEALNVFQRRGSN